MASRDRWNSLQTNRSGGKAENYTPSDLELGQMPPAQRLDMFLRETEKIQDDIQRIANNTSQLRALHQKSLGAVDRSSAEQVDELTDATSSLIQDTRARIKVLSAQSAATASDAQVQGNQQKALATRLMNVARDFQTVQTDATEKYRSQMARQYRVARPGATDEEVQEAIDSDTPVFQQELLSARAGQQRQALQHVQTRHEELVKIEQSINELLALFQDMQMLLDTQQVQVDTIQHHIEDTDTNTKLGSAQMSKAIRSAKSSRKMKWILTCIIFFVIVIIVLVILIKLGVFSHSSSTPAATPAATPVATATA
ncbi:Plasma membrane t-SNARE, secretory vesicle fusion [Thoreauomyces humboldtii]|nr:Plasma membrane t-SNARE, secretory vesicle fusion [Thoreauomyces humboldtii]